MPVHDLLEKRARRARRGPGCDATCLTQMRLPERQQAAAAQDAGGEVVAARPQFLQWDLLAAWMRSTAQDRWR